MKKASNKKRISPAGWLWILAATLLALILVSFALGRYGVPLAEVLRILLSRIFPMEESWSGAMAASVLNVRLPRIVMACLIGCSLSMAGAVYQGVFQNPMASPDVLGASDGAAFGAALSILLGASNREITLSAFVFSIATVVIVFLIAKAAPGSRVVNLVLAGIMISSLFKAGTSYLKLVADPSNQLPAITYWLMGSLNGMKWAQVGQAIAPMLIGAVPLFSCAGASTC